ncbi:3-keto-5-aminohexanoate cleavage protein [Kordiimonas gwangyangensis]|uniref:3-keto-5-aminohexanoate cleavage protein n=1 Tax=Kordiimonas gwangyangensis TaxID=288022 RepID=UPI00036F5AA6|nr:3-keto-5-aminohexanoate cleavage protein [Kordiimonas gwangyangensis]
MADKITLTCALTGVLTDPNQHNVPVTPEQMAAEAKAAYDQGATIMHCHYRQQADGKGHLPSWDGALAKEINDAIRAACPGVVINMTTGVVGREQGEVLKYLAHNKPEMAALNAGSLNYLKTRKDGSWAWPPMVFLNPVDKITEMLAVMKDHNIVPEFECFDVGIVRSVGLYLENGMVSHADYNFVMGVASGMPCDADLLPLLVKYKHPDSPWQATLIGRADVWPVHQRVAELGGNLRTGLEDCFYLPNGDKARSNGEMIEALANCARNAGREITSAEETRAIIKSQAWH